MDAVLQLTRLNGPVFALNPDLIERAEATPDTVVTLVNGSKYVIRESLDELIELILSYKGTLVAAAQQWSTTPWTSPSVTSPEPAGRRPTHTQATVVALRPEES
jgi:flagellar protein FlbD